MQTIQDELRGFIIDTFLFGQKDASLANDDSFLDAGIIDSTGVLELVAFLEQRYEIPIEDEDLMPANLDSVNRLVVFITRKLNGKAPAALAN